MSSKFDAIVVGSGCTGGWVAKELTEAGLRTLVLDGGPPVKPADLPRPGWTPTPSWKTPASQTIQARHPGYSEASANLFVNDLEHPYSTPPGKPFSWIRSRQVGGRSVIWGRICLRMSDHEFKAASADGFGEDWPIDHAELAPHYARVEQLMQVCGNRDGVAQLPDGAFLPPAPLTRADLDFRRRIEARWPERRVIPHRGIDEPATNTSWPIHSAQGSTLAAAEATGRLVLRSDAVVAQVLSSGMRARGVRIVDRVSLAQEEVEARVVVLCAGTIESTRILLNSATREHPQGLGNASDTLGRFLTDRPSGFIAGAIDPSLHSAHAVPVDGPHGVFVPRFRNLHGERRHYRRGFGIWGALGRGPFTQGFLLVVQGEMLTLPDNRVTLDPARSDHWGVPLAMIDCEWSKNDRDQIDDGLDCAREMAAEAGYGVQQTGELGIPGGFIHELGTARMGSNPATSFLDGNNRCWNVANLFVADGASCTSSGYQNPTLTLMALASRCGRFVATEFRAGRL